jgi:hypothetical protein
MADKNITIGIKTTGASRAADDISKVEDAAGGLTEKLEDLNVGSTGTAEATDVLSEAMGGSGSGSLQKALEVTGEAGRNLSGVIGGPLSRAISSLSGGPLAVLTAAVAVAINVFSKWRESLRLAEQEGLERVAESASRAAEKIKELRAAASAREFDAYKDSLSDISDIQRQLRVDTDTIGLGAARERAAASLEILRQTGRLSEVEKSMASATGNDALRLAQERLAIVERILDAELRISEVTREQAFAVAQAGLAGKRSELSAAESDTAAAAQLKAEREIRLSEARLQFENARGLAGGVESLQARIKELETAEVPFSRSGPFGGPDTSPATMQLVSQMMAERNTEIAGLKDLLSQAIAAQDKLKALEGQRAEAETALKTAAAELEKQSASQQETAKAVAEAARSLDVLASQQDIARTSEVEIKATEEIGKVGQDISQLAREAIAAIQANAAGQGRGINLGEAEAIGRAQQLLNDSTPDAQQGSQLAGILQSLSNNLNAKDAVLSNGINQIISATKQLATKYQGLADRIAELQTQVNQIK